MRNLNRGILLSMVLCLLFGWMLLIAEEPVKATSGETPYAVEVTGLKLNVRNGAGTPFQIICTVTKDTKLAVVGEKVGWLEIMLPPNAPCWIASKFADVKEGEDKGIIKEDHVNVRISMDAKSSGNIVGQLAKDTEVVIIDKKGEWYKILPQESLTGWVNKKFTKNWGDYKKYQEWYNEAVKNRLTKDKKQGDLKEKFAKAEALYESESAKSYLDQDFGEAIALYKEVIDFSDSKDMVNKSKSRVKQVEPRQQILSEYRETIKQKDQKIDDVRATYIKKIENLLASLTEKPQYIAQGWVDDMGKVYKRPGSHRLIKGDEVLYYLKSDTVKLADYYKRFVGVRGQVVEAPGWPQKTIIVEEIDILDGAK